MRIAGLQHNDAVFHPERDIAAEIYEIAKNNYTRNGMLEDSTMNPLVTTMLAEANIKGVSPSQLVDFSLLQQALK